MHKLSANQHTNCVTASSSPFMNSTHTSVLSIQINPLTFFRFSRLFGLFVGRSGQIYIYTYFATMPTHGLQKEVLTPFHSKKGNTRKTQNTGGLPDPASLIQLVFLNLLPGLNISAWNSVSP